MPRVTAPSRSFAFCLVVLGLTVEGATAPIDFSAPVIVPSFTPDARAYAQDRIIVKLKQQEGLVLQQANPVAGVRVVLTRGANLAASVKAYTNRPDVEYAEPDYLLAADAIPNDALFSNQWGLMKIGAPSVWNLTTGSKNVTVCVVDSGIDYTHPDIKPNMHPLIGWNLLDGSNKPMDDLTHGTHVAGILGAAGNNSNLVAGVNWQIKLLACKFMDAKGLGYTSKAADCIGRCVKQGAHIIQASFSGAGYSQTLKNAIAWAGTKGVLFVSSAGNKASSLDKMAVYPASYGLPNQLVVASSTYNDQLSGFSNWSPCKVHIAAPGEYILSTLPKAATGYMSGTSMATPFVSGSAALLLSMGGANLTVAKLRSLLMDTAVKAPGLKGKVLSGRLSIEAALAQYRLETRIVLPTPGPCKANPTGCDLVCNAKNECTYVPKPVARAAAIPPQAAAVSPRASAPAQVATPSQPKSDGTRRLLRWNSR